MRHVKIKAAVILLIGIIVLSGCDPINTVKGTGVSVGTGAVLGAGLSAIFGGGKARHGVPASALHWEALRAPLSGRKWLNRKKNWHPLKALK